MYILLKMADGMRIQEQRKKNIKKNKMLLGFPFYNLRLSCIRRQGVAMYSAVNISVCEHDRNYELQE